MERLTGPLEGIYIAAYTAELEDRFYGYGKLCAIRPDDVWTVAAGVRLSQFLDLCRLCSEPGGSMGDPHRSRSFAVGRWLTETSAGRLSPGHARFFGAAKPCQTPCINVPGCRKVRKKGLLRPFSEQTEI
jgi:hypothetical protein